MTDSHPIGRCLVALALALMAAPAVADDEPGANELTVAMLKSVERGRYIVTTSGCNDCHTPFHDGPAGPEPDMSRMLSGHPESLSVSEAPTAPPAPWGMMATYTSTAWAGPWGVSFTANLTPDEDTGLGKWTFAEFRDTIRSGRHLGRGRLILPPMPIAMYKNFTDEDLEAIYRYLRTIPPVRNRVPDPLIPGEPLAD